MVGLGEVASVGLLSVWVRCALHLFGAACALASSAWVSLVSVLVGFRQVGFADAVFWSEVGVLG